MYDLCCLLSGGAVMRAETGVPILPNFSKHSSLMRDTSLCKSHIAETLPNINHNHNHNHKLIYSWFVSS